MRVRKCVKYAVRTGKKSVESVRESIQENMLGNRRRRRYRSEKRADRRLAEHECIKCAGKCADMKTDEVCSQEEDCTNLYGVQIRCADFDFSGNGQNSALLTEMSGI